MRARAGMKPGVAEIPPKSPPPEAYVSRTAARIAAAILAGGSSAGKIPRCFSRRTAKSYSVITEAPAKTEATPGTDARRFRRCSRSSLDGTRRTCSSEGSRPARPKYRRISRSSSAGNGPAYSREMAGSRSGIPPLYLRIRPCHRRARGGKWRREETRMPLSHEGAHPCAVRPGGVEIPVQRRPHGRGGPGSPLHGPRPRPGAPGPRRGHRRRAHRGGPRRATAAGWWRRT